MDPQAVLDATSSSTVQTAIGSFTLPQPSEMMSAEKRPDYNYR